MKETVLIVHGLGGSGPGHWQTWLAEELRERGVAVSYPDLPDPDTPSLRTWTDAIGGEVERLGPEGLRVACHSLGAVTWLHLAARSRRRLAERVLLVAPPSAGTGVPEIAEFVPAPLDRDAVAEAAGTTRLICAASGDPYCPEGPAVWEPLGVPTTLVEGGGHLNLDAGFGPWPLALDWATCAESS